VVTVVGIAATVVGIAATDPGIAATVVGIAATVVDTGATDPGVEAIDAGNAGTDVGMVPLKYVGMTPPTDPGLVVNVEGTDCTLGKLLTTVGLLFIIDTLSNGSLGYTVLLRNEVKLSLRLQSK